jgi:hypothetical protein
VTVQRDGGPAALAPQDPDDVRPPWEWLPALDVQADVPKALLHPVLSLALVTTGRVRRAKSDEGAEGLEQRLLVRVDVREERPVELAEREPVRGCHGAHRSTHATARTGHPLAPGIGSGNAAKRKR